MKHEKLFQPILRKKLQLQTTCIEICEAIDGTVGNWTSCVAAVKFDESNTTVKHWLWLENKPFMKTMRHFKSEVQFLAEILIFSLLNKII